MVVVRLHVVVARWRRGTGTLGRLEGSGVLLAKNLRRPPVPHIVSMICDSFLKLST